MYHSMTIIPENTDIFNSKGKMNGKNTWDDWRLIPSSRPLYSPPEPKTNYIDIPGADGVIDASEAISGYPVYNNREGSIEFYVMNEGWKEDIPNKNSIPYEIVDKRVALPSITFKCASDEVTLTVSIRARNDYKGRAVNILKFDSAYAPYKDILKVGYNTTTGSLVMFTITHDGKIQMDASTNRVSKNDVLSLSLSWIHETEYGWQNKYSDIMDYLHGRRMKIILEDDPAYYYLGRFSVNDWNSEKDWSKIVFDYNVDPYKYELFATNEPWLWDPFSFIDGVIRSTEDHMNLTVGETPVDIAVPWITMPVTPTFYIQRTDNVSGSAPLHIEFFKGDPTNRNNLIKEKVESFPVSTKQYTKRYYDMKLMKNVKYIRLVAGSGELYEGYSFIVSVVYRGGRL